MRPAHRHVTVLLHGIDFPGREFEGRHGIRVGIQKGDEVVDDVPGDAERADFRFELRVEEHPKTGAPNFLGPFAHGKPDERFLYLCWGVRSGPVFHGFRRAKIHLKHLDGQVVDRAIRSGRPIEATVRLTDAKGGPLCASVKPDRIAWDL